MTNPSDVVSPTSPTPVLPTITFVTDDKGKFTEGKCSQDGDTFTAKNVFLSQESIKKDLNNQFEQHLTEKHSTVKA
jgi:hypothetical protein